MLKLAQRSRAIKCTARRGRRRGGLPHSSEDLPRGGFIGHTHTLEEEGEGPSPLSGADWQRQPGGAPARAGADQVGKDLEGRSPEHGPARGGGTTPPVGLGQEGGISSSPTTQSQPAHRMPESPKQPLPPRRARARAALADNKEEVSRASPPVVVLSGFGTGGGRRRLEATSCTPAAPLVGLLGPDADLQPPVVVIPEGGGGIPPPPCSTYHPDDHELTQILDATFPTLDTPNHDGDANPNHDAPLFRVARPLRSPPSLQTPPTVALGTLSLLQGWPQVGRALRQCREAECRRTLLSPPVTSVSQLALTPGVRSPLSTPQ